MAVGSHAPAGLAYQVGPEFGIPPQVPIKNLLPNNQQANARSTNQPTRSCSTASRFSGAQAVGLLHLCLINGLASHPWRLPCRCRSDAQLPSSLCRVPVPFVRCPAGRLELAAFSNALLNAFWNAFSKFFSSSKAPICCVIEQSGHGARHPRLYAWLEICASSRHPRASGIATSPRKPSFLAL